MTLNPNGTFSYTPDDGFVGVDSFRYKVNDGVLNSRVKPVFITVGQGLAPLQNGHDRTQDSFLHDGALTLSQPLGAGVSLEYRSDTVPISIIPIETFLTPGTAVPETITVNLTVGGVNSGAVTYDATGMEVGTPYRFTLRALTSGKATGMYDWTATFELNYPSSTMTRHFHGQVSVVNRTDTEFGSGWGVDGVDRLHVQSDGALLVNGDGTDLWFNKPGGVFNRAEGDLAYSQLVDNGNGYTLTDKFGNTREFDTNGYITSMKYANNSNPTYTYEYSQNRINKIVDEFSREFNFNYDSNDNLSSVNDFFGRDSFIMFTAVPESSTKFDLTSVKVADEVFPNYTSPEWNYQYLSIGGKQFLRKAIDPANNQTTYGYNNGTRTVKRIDYADSTTSFFYPKRDRAIRYTNTSSTAPLRTLAKVSDINPRYIVQREGGASQTKFDTDRFGNVTWLREHLGYESTFEYDENSRLYRETGADPDNGGPGQAPITKYGYNSPGDVVVTVNADGNDSTAIFNSLSRMTSFTDELLHEQKWTYDSVGNMESYTDAEGNDWLYTWDNHGNMLTESTPVVTTNAGGGIGGPGGGGGGSRIVTTYDYEPTIYNRLEEITFDDGTTQQFGWSTADQLETFTDELGRVTAYEYDPLDRLTKTTLPDPDGSGGPKTSPVYETRYGSDLLAEYEIDAMGNQTRFQYDSMLRLERITLPDPDGPGSPLLSPEYVYTYDPAGNLKTESLPEFDGGKVITHMYDANHRLINSQGPLTGQLTTYDYDRLNRLTQTTDASNRVVQYKYDVLDRMTDIVDHAGPTTSFAFDDASRLVSTTDQIGRVTSYDYLDNNWLEVTTLPDPDGSGDFESPTYTNVYDEIGRVRKVIDPSERFTESIYDTKHRIIQSIGLDPDGASGLLQAPKTHYLVDDVGNVESMTDAVGNVSTYVFDDLDRIKSVTLPDPDGPTGSKTSPVYSVDYDAVGNTISQTDALGRVTAITYDNLYRQKTVTQPDPDGGGNQTSPVWTFNYNNQNVLDNVLDPLGKTVSRGYDDAGRLESFTNRASNTTNYGYDDLDRLTSITTPDPDGAGGQTSSVTNYYYDIYSRLKSVKDANGKSTIYSYDDAGQLTELLDASGNATLYAYDGLGRKTKETDARGKSTSYDHNSVGRLVRTVDANGNVTRFVNDGYDTIEKWFQYEDVPSTTVTSTGSADVSVNFFNFDLETTDGDFFRLNINGETTKWIHAATPNQLIEDAIEELDSFSGGVTATKAGLNRLDIDFDGPTPQVTADVFLEDEGDLVNEITYERDALYRLTSVSDLDSTFDYGYIYDGLGRVTQQTENIGGLAPNITLDIGYDAVSNRTSLSATLGTSKDYLNSYTFDKLDRLKNLQQQDQSGGNEVAPKRMLQGYNSLGQKTYVHRHESTTTAKPVLRTAFTYDSANRRLTGIHHRKLSVGGANTQLNRYTFTYDDMDRFKSIYSATDRLSSFTHDKLSQLTDANHAVPRPDEAYSFDDTGNRTGGGYTTQADNLTSSDDTYNYQYDNVGNRTKRTNIQTGQYDDYSWDHRNRLESVESFTSAGVLTEEVVYTYDAFNRMVGRTHDPDGSGSAPATDQFFAGFDGDNPTFEFDGANASDLKHRNLWEGDHLIAQEDVSSLNTEGDVLWPLTDQVGTIRDIAKINSSNEFEIVNHRVYDSFGNLTSETNSSVDLDYGFTGRFTDDATGLTFHINRWLDPRTGKWLSDDPISFAAGDTNLQRYVSNEVLAYYDVDGLLAEPVLSINGDLSSGQGSDDDERAWWYPGNWPSILAESIFGDEEERREMMFGNRLEDENRLADDIALQKNKISNPTKFMRDGKRGTPLAEESIKQGAELAINHLAGGGLMAAPGGGAIAGGTKTGIKKGTNRTIDKIDVHVGMSKPSQKHLLDLPKPAPVISTISKANSPVWKELNPFRGKTKTNGLTGSKRRFYEWDHTHSDIEIYNGKGVHLGSIDPTTGKTIKPAVPGRTIDL